MSPLFFIGFAIIGVVVAQRTDVCSQVQLMSQYCSTQVGNGTAIGEVATMGVLEKRMDSKLTEMEARLRQTLESPPDVNYTLVEEIITQRFKGVEERVIQQLGEPPKVNYTAIEESISTRFERLEALVNDGGESEDSIVNYARIFGQVDERFSAIRGYIDEKFALLVNDTAAYQQAIEGMERKMNLSDCRDIRLEDAKLCNATGGVFDIYRGVKRYEVYCDSYTDGGGWTVFQRRMDGSLLFNRTWNEYVEGFGEPHREFWLGLRKLHELLQAGTHELRIDLMDSSGRIRFAKYGVFYVFGKANNYNIILQSHSGDIGNYLASGYSFTTIDRDNDIWGRNCADNFLGGGWWYSNCGYSALNGRYNDKLYWHTFGNIVRSEMKFRRLPEDS